VAKALYLPSQNTVDCYKSFCSVSKFWSPTQLFFSSWNTGSIIPLVSITYLALVHNYNTIKYICFINPRQRADMHLVAFYSMKNSFWNFFKKFKHDLTVKSKVIILLSYYFGMIQTDFFPTLNPSNWSINIFVKSST
jgi:hypothetical protein